MIQTSFIKKIVLTMLLIGISLEASEKPVYICNDSGEWAPYFYYERDSNGNKTKKIVGATVDSLDAIFKIVEQKYVFELLPWKRCLEHVKRYDKTLTYEMFSEAGINSWRKEHFLHTQEPVYKRTNVFYYNKEKFPKGIKLETVKDMEKYKICVSSGFSYERYVKLGLDPKFIDTSHKSDYYDVIRKISLGYCDIMPANLAVVEGGIKIGQFNIPDNISYFEDVTVKKPFFYHYWISKKSPRANELKKQIDSAISKLKRSGEWEKIYSKYLSNGSGLSK